MEPVVDKNGVAELLAVSPRTVEGWVARGEIPFYRVNRMVRFRVSQVEAWLEDRHQPQRN